ncbi:MAG: topoisomerase protein [Candidatus Falkowbacteria bacterium GW2011_GWA2_39_24]|uniref:DNA topoisomerase 1 n=1 Tax=Candidatus Falkowbacteria bacterium GW2011_GWA2_39_24 TaxID=1618634 RepID=A0A0G0NGA6_9BACT|nr:MAG: topoisomerase protein [Candidatus Falkowbacteria bacterium GW2011_GWA2_39_24]
MKALAAKADQVILATDEDREGEAIAWHLSEALKLKNPDRIVFHEITKPALIKALDKPRKIDFKLVDAQQARRVLDRLVGYKLSPFLWKKVAKGLSAGRVQSVAVRLTVERERAIQDFKAEEYWTIEADLATSNQKTIIAQLEKIADKKIDKLAINTQDQANEIVADLAKEKFVITNIEKKETKKQAPTPFKTSTLQQTANGRLGYSAKQTMRLAQQLYEMGFITYMRTDSLNLSEQFLQDAHDYLSKTLGKEYSLDKPNRFKTKAKGAQEAHEAIRPTSAEQTPDQLNSKLSPQQLRLYKLIWQRSVASQMPAAIMDNTHIDITAGKYGLAAHGQILKFAGWLKIYPTKSQELELPEAKVKDKLDLVSVKPEQHSTQPPARYSDATLVKELEKYEIGRPSTYAPTIATIEARNYVQRDENKRLKPTDIAFVVIDLLLEHFPKIVDMEFTAKMENEFDEIAEGKLKWQPMIKEFYEPFQANLDAKYKEVNKGDIVPEETSKEICDKCQSPMIIKTGRYGKFLACSGFPKCKNIKPLNGDRDNDGKPDNTQAAELQKKYANEVCDKCGEPMAVKVGKYGPFLGCTGYPKCKTIKNISENGNGKTGIKCPKCQTGDIVQKRGRRGLFYACNNYPDCKNAYWAKPTGEVCPECSSLLVTDKEGAKCSNKECDYTK